MTWLALIDSGNYGRRWIPLHCFRALAPRKPVASSWQGTVLVLYWSYYSSGLVEPPLLIQPFVLFQDKRLQALTELRLGLRTNSKLYYHNLPALPQVGKRCENYIQKRPTSYDLSKLSLSWCLVIMC
jgi:hypothetical protein